MKKLQTILAISVMVLGFLLAPIGLTKAWTRTGFELPDYIAFTYLDFRNIHSSSGKYVYAIGKNQQTNNLLVYVYSDTGALLAQSSTTVLYGADITTLTYKGISIYDCGTYVIIISSIYEYKTPGTYYNVVYAHKYDLSSYQFTQLGVGVTGATPAPTTWAFSKPYLYNNILHTLISIDTATTDKTGIFKVNLATFATSWSETSSTAIHAGPIFAILNGQYLYTIGAKPGDTTRPTYCYVNLATNTITSIADHPTPAHWRIDTYLSLKYLGGGTYQRSDNKYMVYFVWGWCDNYGELEIIQHRLLFNSSGIAPASFEAQNQRIGVFSQSSNLAEQEVAWAGGYLEAKDIIQIWRMVQSAAYSGVFYCYRDEFTVPDFEDMENSYLSYDEHLLRQNECVFENMYWRISRMPASTMQITENSNNINVYVYYGLLAGMRVYSIVTSHIPVGTLYTSTQYQWKILTKVNEVAASGISVTMKIDNQSIGTKTSDSNGYVYFTLLTTLAGYHVLSYDLFQAGEYQKTFTENAVFDSLVGEEEGAGLMSTMLTSIFALVPILLVVLLPAFMLLPILGPIGFLIGLVLGTFIGAGAGIIPAHVTLLILLLVAVYVVFRSKAPTGGGEA